MRKEHHQPENSTFEKPCFEIRVFMDGDQWCAVFTNFINLQESEAGFGHTEEAAVTQLIESWRNS